MAKKNNDSIKPWEKFYPIVFAFATFVCGFVYIRIMNPRYTSSFDNVLNATITFSSVLIGFVGVLLGLLFGLSDTPVIKKLFERSEKYVLKRYFMEAILSGIVLIFISMTLFLKDSIQAIISFTILNLDAYNFLFVIWIALVTYDVLTTWRIIHIIMHILFSDKIDKNTPIASMTLSENEQNELRLKYKK